MCARVTERSLHPGCVIVDYYGTFNAVACSARWGLVASIEIEVCVKRRVLFFLGVVLRGVPK